MLIWNIIYCHDLSWSKILKMFVIALNLTWWIILWPILITEKGTQDVQFVTYNSIAETVSKVAWSNSFICQHDVLNHEKNVLAEARQWSAIQLALQFHFENHSLLAPSYFVWQTLIAHLACTQPIQPWALFNNLYFLKYANPLATFRRVIGDCDYVTITYLLIKD